MNYHKICTILCYLFIVYIIVFFLGCVDQTDCSVYGKDYACSDEFKEWAKATCPRFCGLCNGRKRIYNTLTKKNKTKTIQISI